MAHILELNFERTWRGGERQTLYNMLGFRQAGQQVALVCRKGYPLEEKARLEGFQTYAFANIFGVIIFLVFRCRKYKILHAQTSHILTYCVFTKLFHGAKVVFTRRVDFVPKGKMTLLKYSLTDEIVGISNAVKQILQNFTGRDVTMISDIAVAGKLDEARGMHWRDAAGWQPGMHVIGTIAAMVPHKDPVNMIEAIRILAAKRNDFIFLHFGSGEMENMLRGKLKEYHLDGTYKLMGFHHRVEDVLSVFNVFVMSSEEEGLGSSVLDAFLYNVPVVATNAGGLPDLLQDGRGVICPKKSPQQLADGINDMLDQPGLRQSCAVAAHRYVIAYHSLAYITTEYMQLFKKACPFF